MKKSTKILVPAAVILALGMAASVTGTVAWYSTTAASKTENISALGALTVASGAESLSSVRFNVAAHTGAPTSLVITNRTGRSYMRAGDVFTEVKATDTGSTCGTGYKQGSTTWDVTLTNGDGSAAPSTDSLASIAGTYTINVSAGGSVKLALAQTSTLGNKETADPAVNFAAPSTGGSVAGGALGAAATQTVAVMKIVIGADGSVKYKTDASAGFVTEGTTWADTTVAIQSAVTYYGLEVLNATAEETPVVASGSVLTPDVAEIA